MSDVQPKQLTIFLEMFRLIDRIENIENRDKFLGEIFDWYFKNKEPDLKPNSYEEDVWINITKPIKSYKSKVVNGSKGGRPRKNKKSEIKSETKSEMESETKTTSDVIVVVNNNKNNNIEDKDKSMREGEETTSHKVPDSIITFVESNYGRSLTPYEFEEVIMLVKENSETIVLKAYQVAFEQSKNSLSYIKGILSVWKDNNLDSLEKIENNLKSGIKKSASERKMEDVFSRARKRLKESESNDL